MFDIQTCLAKDVRTEHQHIDSKIRGLAGDRYDITGENSNDPAIRQRPGVIIHIDNRTAAAAQYNHAVFRQHVTTPLHDRITT